MGKKRQTQILLFEQCRQSGIYTFDNAQVKRLCEQTGFKNPFDVTKVDQSAKLPDEVRDAGYCIVHLGRGRHRFVRALDSWYHRFETMDESERHSWEYRPSLLNHTDESESNMISLVYNQRVIQDFLYGEITAPKIYMSRRTKIDLEYSIDGIHDVQATRLQMEMDATFELNGVVTIVEGKNSFPADFAVYQLFHPFLDYHLKDIAGVSGINCCYLLKKSYRDRHVIRLYLYKFGDIGDIASIVLVKKAEYVLQNRNAP